MTNDLRFPSEMSHSTKNKIRKLNNNTHVENLGFSAALYTTRDVWQTSSSSTTTTADHDETNNNSNNNKTRSSMWGSVFHAEEPTAAATSGEQQQASSSGTSKRRVLDKKQHKRLKKIFQRYASHRDSISGSPLMTPDDFIRSIIDRNQQQATTAAPKKAPDSNTLRLLFQMADTKETGMINLSEYIILFKFLTTPENEFEMAFRMFDVNNDGSISKDEFKHALKNNRYVNTDFDFDCELMTRFFGRDGHSTLSYHQFSQFMRLLTEEIRRQEFQRMDSDGDGYISASQFGQLLTGYISQSELPQRINQNIRKLSETSEKISYAEFDAFNRIMSNLQAVASSIRNAAGPDGKIDKTSFSRAARRITGIVLSPMEVSIIFKMFASSNEDVLSREDYEEFINILNHDTERRQAVLDAWSRDAISSKDPIAEMTWQERVMSGAVKVATKTLYGGIAGAIGATAVYPIDMVKTRMQNQRGGGPQLYASSIDCFKQIYKFEGFKGLYRGLGPQLIGVAPEKAIKLVTNDFLRDWFGGSGEEGEIYFPLEVLAGMGAGASQVVFTNPIEIVKIRLQVQGEIARQEGIAPKSALTIIKELGLSGLYRGSTACFARDIPFSGIYFPTYAYLKEKFKNEGEVETQGWGLLLAGCIAGGISASSTTPFDVVKTRLQVEARKGQATYSGIMDCLGQVYKQEGPKALFKGVVPRVVRSSPQFGVTLLAYEFLQRFVQPKEESQKEEEKSRLAAGVPLADEDIETIRQMVNVKTRNFASLFGKQPTTDRAEQ